ncbi:MAG TPA: hypothetical protein VEK36_02175, partial [Candidatus Paceibacterota bacterium]|nr:hypothetical protein [Candidatus Paceibacterota bacterium]
MNPSDSDNSGSKNRDGKNAEIDATDSSTGTNDLERAATSSQTPELPNGDASLSEVEVEGKRFIATSVLARNFGYDSDHIGRLARQGKVENIRIGKRWFVTRTSLQNHKREAYEQKRLSALQSIKVVRNVSPEVKELPRRPIIVPSLALFHVADRLRASRIYLSSSFKGGFNYILLALFVLAVLLSPVSGDYHPKYALNPRKSYSFWNNIKTDLSKNSSYALNAVKDTERLAIKGISLPKQPVLYSVKFKGIHPFPNNHQLLSLFNQKIQEFKNQSQNIITLFNDSFRSDYTLNFKKPPHPTYGLNIKEFSNFKPRSVGQIWQELRQNYWLRIPQTVTLLPRPKLREPISTQRQLTLNLPDLKELNRFSWNYIYKAADKLNIAYGNGLSILREVPFYKGIHYPIAYRESKYDYGFSQIIKNLAGIRTLQVRLGIAFYPFNISLKHPTYGLNIEEFSGFKLQSTWQNIRKSILIGDLSLHNVQFKQFNSVKSEIAQYQNWIKESVNKPKPRLSLGYLSGKKLLKILSRNINSWAENSYALYLNFFKERPEISFLPKISFNFPWKGIKLSSGIVRVSPVPSPQVKENPPVSELPAENDKTLISELLRWFRFSSNTTPQVTRTVTTRVDEKYIRSVVNTVLNERLQLPPLEQFNNLVSEFNGIKDIVSKNVIDYSKITANYVFSNVNGVLDTTEFQGKSLIVSNSVSASQYSGPAFNGISNCNTESQTLNWDSSTGKFSCLTDDSSVGSAPRTEKSGTQVLANSSIFNFDDGNFNVVASGTTETVINLDWTNGPASRSANQTITGFWIFNNRASVTSNFEVQGNASVSALFGSAFTGISNCNTESQTLNWDSSSGRFSCLSDDTGAGGSAAPFKGVSIREGSGAFTHYGSISFEAGNFNLTAPTASESYVRLDWLNGPASRSANQTITGFWNFTAASTQLTGLELTNNASI